MAKIKQVSFKVLDMVPNRRSIMSFELGALETSSDSAKYIRSIHFREEVKILRVTYNTGEMKEFIRPEMDFLWCDEEEAELIVSEGRKLYDRRAKEIVSRNKK